MLKSKQILKQHPPTYMHHFTNTQIPKVLTKYFKNKNINHLAVTQFDGKGCFGGLKKNIKQNETCTGNISCGFTFS